MNWNLFPQLHPSEYNCMFGFAAHLYTIVSIQIASAIRKCLTKVNRKPNSYCKTTVVRIDNAVADISLVPCCLFISLIPKNALICSANVNGWAREKQCARDLSVSLWPKVKWLWVHKLCRFCIECSLQLVHVSQRPNTMRNWNWFSMLFFMTAQPHSPS